jgi:hypothetical protein
MAHPPRAQARHSLRIERLETRVVATAAPLLAFDMGTRRSPGDEGFVRVEDRSRYTAETGFGWTKGRVSGLDRAVGPALTRDMILTADATFTIDLPNGPYRLEVLLGDPGKTIRDRMVVTVPGLRPVVVTTRPQRSERVVMDVEVTDGRLSVRLQDRGGKDRSVAVQALTVAPRSGSELPPAPIVTALRGQGAFLHEIMSPYQTTQTLIRVLLPDSYDPAKRYRTVYVLPVEAADGRRFGDGFAQVRLANLHNLHDTVFIAPAFSDMPWLVDHQRDPRLRQESHFIEVVLPFVEARYSLQAGPEGRLLLGFSKSGTAAFHLLLRHPHLFGRALAWDAPLAMNDPKEGKDYERILGSRANFSNYRLPPLLGERAALLAGGPPRLLIAGAGNPVTEMGHARIAALMHELGIPHVYERGPGLLHTWESGWVPGAVTSLLQ